MKIASRSAIPKNVMHPAQSATARLVSVKEENWTKIEQEIEKLVAGAFLSSFLQVTFERLASRDFLDYFRGRKLDHSLLTKLRIILLSVDKIVEDVEERQYRDHRVKLWLDELKDEVFKAQDLLDDIAIEASRQELDAESQSTAVIRKVRGFFTALGNQNQFDKTIESGIKVVLNNLEYLIKQSEILAFREGPSTGFQLGVNRKEYKRLRTTSLIDESNMYGRDADKQEIVDKLLSQNMGGNQLPMDVIAITGMGGMGKTTLARLVYDHVKMKDQFQYHVWVCVAEEFDAHQITKVILKSLDPEIKILDDFQLCRRKLKEELMGKKFLLVLDDVWNENREIWEDFQALLRQVAPQSKILVTTRNRKVAEVMCCTFTHPLMPLQEGDSWKLFAKHAFGNQHDNEDQNLEEIGRKIVNKCGGLPLAIKTLGSLLHRKLSSQYWDKILESEIWQLSENDSNTIPSLRLSYHYLPSNLKRCFAYCSIFPKDYDIDKNVLIQLWMADGLIYPTQRSTSLEETGDEIFKDLESRSFFEPSKIGGDYFIMHDLLNDLAKSIAGEFFVSLDATQAQDMSTKTRYLSYIRYKSDNVDIFEKVLKCHQLRSFIQFDSLSIGDDIMSRLCRLKYIRQLSLKGSQNLRSLTDGISNLKHLHYLDLSFTSIKKLPNSICLLINLQTLKLTYCDDLTELPSNLYKLINLRHLDLEGCGIRKMPRGMGKLNQLRTMNQFVVAKKGGSNIKELGALNHLTGSLTISNMEYVSDPTDMREAKLKEKKLVELTLSYQGDSYSREEAQCQEHVLEALEPNQSVKELTVERYRGTKFPKWLLHFLPNLVSLYLGSCGNCAGLPPLGQLPSLQKLVIREFHGIKVIGEEFYGNGSLIAQPFPSLLYLMFWDMREWEEWDVCYEGEGFPCLEELRIYDCPKLTKSLPQHLPCLKKLNIFGCWNLEATLPKSSSIEMLFLRDCMKISVKDMPTWSISDVLPPLHDLYLCNCPAMESLPQGGMLSSLQRLTIRGCSKVIACGRDWGLHELLSLKQLEISDDVMEWFPEEERLLPPNLQSLSFDCCHNLRRINHRGLVHLHSLTSLSFYKCPRMSFEGMPEEDALPPSLSHLLVDFGCPLLRERCEKEKGPDWPKIAHIPNVSIYSLEAKVPKIRAQGQACPKSEDCISLYDSKKCDAAGPVSRCKAGFCICCERPSNSI
ncbi:putative disease resistance RPP13-like protein 1 [Neltuma alba]|uniref:putative disease resistance RPP13-like protein 1 n=1 Tax=Neltuma alba TaxID=207710 RepID=UPI0010A30844|nr:putative disease resistance RPP13-like protein 1 [Prosopis alba]